MTSLNDLVQLIKPVEATFECYFVVDYLVERIIVLINDDNKLLVSLIVVLSQHFSQEVPRVEIKVLAMVDAGQIQHAAGLVALFKYQLRQKQL